MQKIMPMKHEFRAGDNVEWNSEAGRVCGTIKKGVTSAIKFKTYTVRASKEKQSQTLRRTQIEHTGK
jgi:hypothetical protein